MGDSEENLDDVIERLRKRYAPVKDPKCRVCGHEMRVGMAGQGRVEWFCDSDGASPLRKEGQAR